MSTTRVATPSSLEEEKRRFRALARATRAEIAAAPPEDTPARIRCQLFEWILPVGDVSISGFWPLRTELDTRPILEALHAAGYTSCLPVVAQHRAPLVFRVWTPDMDLVAGPFGESTPPPEAPSAVPDIVLVPGLAFDRQGYRVGYGAGFYDRTLAALRAVKPITAVGIGYAGQIFAEVPRAPTDEPLDWIITEEEAIACGAQYPALARELVVPADNDHAGDHAHAPGSGDVTYGGDYAAEQ